MQELTPLDILEQKTALQTLEGDHRTALVALDEIAQQTVQKNVCMLAGASGAVSRARVHACCMHLGPHPTDCRQSLSLHSGRSVCILDAACTDWVQFVEINTGQAARVPKEGKCLLQLRPTKGADSAQACGRTHKHTTRNVRSVQSLQSPLWFP